MSPSVGASPPESFLRVIGLRKRYTRGGLWRGTVRISAVDGVDFEIPRGRTLAIVGDSGSGKSTVARCVSRLEKPDSGEILLRETDIAKLGSRDLFPLRSRVQMVFQDPITSMNPHFTALAVIEEPLRIQNRGHDLVCDGEQRIQTARSLMEEVGLSPEWLARPIRHFSGGQQQRLALARALAVRPQLLILDETLSGLDLSTQSQIANLLVDLQKAHSLTYLLVSHDLSLVSRLADAIAVMCGGKIVETGPTADVVANPRHPTTKRLLDAAKAAASNFAAVTGASA